MDTNLINWNKLIYIDPGFYASQTSQEPDFIWLNKQRLFCLRMGRPFFSTSGNFDSEVTLIQTQSVSWAKYNVSINKANIFNFFTMFLF